MPTINLNTIEKLRTCLQLQKGNIGTYQTEVGATAQDVTDINDQLGIINSLIEHCELYDANKKTAFGVKDQCYRGDENEPVAAVPTTPAFVPPAALVSGILHITNSRNRRFREGPAFDEEIGVALGILTVGPTAPTNPGSVTPTVELFPAASGAMFSCVVGNRVDSDSWIVQIMRTGGAGGGGGGGWQNLGTFTGKSADVTITLTNPGQPEQIQVRIQLRKSNADYGNVSPALTVTVNP